MILEQYIKFLISGGLLGVAAWALQVLLFQLLGGETAADYGLASLLTYAPLLFINYVIQRDLIFNSPGRLYRLVLANILVMLIVSALSPACRWAIARLVDGTIADHTGFLAAALIGATPSFLLSRLFVFRSDPRKSFS